MSRIEQAVTGGLRLYRCTRYAFSPTIILSTPDRLSPNAVSPCTPGFHLAPFSLGCSKPRRVSSLICSPGDAIMTTRVHRDRCVAESIMNTGLHHLANLVQPLKRSQAQRQSLASTPYPHETRHRSVLALLLYAQVRKSIFTCTQSVSNAHSQHPSTEDTVALTENTPRVKIRRQELTIPTQTRLRCQARHIGHLH